MVNKKQKEDFRLLKMRITSLEETVESGNTSIFRKNNEKLIIEKELEIIKEELETFKKLVNHLTAKTLRVKNGDKEEEISFGFLNHNLHFGNF